MKITVVDYGMGNLKSVENALKKLGATPEMVRNPDALDGDGIIVPGVGAFGDGMKNLSKFRQALDERISSGTPFLGICLGLQVLLEKSEESPGVEGFGYIKGKVVKLPKTVRVPQIGWNSLSFPKESSLFEGVPAGSYVYFVHSYAAVPGEDVVTATCDYGMNVTAAVEKNNVYATQFHPEKSGEVGLKILQNFLTECGK